MSKSLALSTCIFYILLMQSVNGAQFLNTTSFLLLSGFAAVPVFATVLVFFYIPLLYCYINLKSSPILYISFVTVFQHYMVKFLRLLYFYQQFYCQSNHSCFCCFLNYLFIKYFYMYLL